MAGKPRPRERVVQPQDQAYCIIPLTHGQVAKVSPHRFEELNAISWSANWYKKVQKYYAITNIKVDGRYRTVLMSRYILGLERGDKTQAEHKDGDTLNNTDENLRIATNAQNQCNRGRNRNNTTGYKGVIFDPTGRSNYVARIKSAGKTIYLGRRATAEAAHRELYIPAALKLHGEFARVA